MRCVICLLCLVCVLTVSTVKGQESKQREVTIDFEGNKVFSNQQLLDVANKCLAKYFQSQDGPDPQVLTRCVNSFLTCQGYLRAVIGKPEAQEQGNSVKVTVPIEEGMRYRLGEITIEGSKLFSPEQLLEMLSLKTGDVAGGAILVWLGQKVKRAYADRGHIQYTFNVEPHFRPISAGESEGIVDFKVDISEGQRFIVRRIEFVGNEHTSDQALRRALLIKEGAPFSQSLYDESIRNLNRLGLFEEIDGDKDMTGKAVGRSAQFDLIISVKERAHP